MADDPTRRSASDRSTKRAAQIVMDWMLENDHLNLHMSDTWKLCHEIARALDEVKLDG